jgi:hypothetical protein
MRTENWQSNTRGLRLVGEEENGSASTIFGPVKAGLTTTHKTQSQALSELLNSLEREVESLHSKYCEAYVTLTSVMDHLVRLTGLLLEKDTTKIENY